MSADGEIDLAELAEIARRRRRALGLSQELLAERAGVSVRALRDLERGCVARPRPTTTGRIADALDLPDDERARFVGASRPRPRAEAVRCLPPDLVTLVGRDGELDRVVSGGAGRAPAPVLVHGPAGAGTTALLVRAAHRLAALARGPVLFLDIADVAGGTPGGDVAAAVTRHVLAALAEPGPGSDPGAARSSTDATATLARVVAGGVLVLDGVRREADAEAFLPLPGLRVLLGSRGPLPGLAGVRRVPLHPLTDAAARELLAAALGADRVAAEPDAVAEIVARCDGWPLALSLVGARIAARPGWPLADVVARLTCSPAALERLRAGDVSVCEVLDAAGCGLGEEALVALREGMAGDSPWAGDLAARGLLWPSGAVGRLVRAWASSRL